MSENFINYEEQGYKDSQILQSAFSLPKHTALWKPIAKNEMKLRTSIFRNNRRSFYILSYLGLIIWAFIIAPILFDLFLPTLASQSPEYYKAVVSLLIESISMIAFLVMFAYPLNNIYKNEGLGFKEALVASPVNAGDIFLGQFIGKLPIYSYAVLIFTPIIIGMINPLLDLNILNYIVIYSTVFGMACFANLLGSILISYLEQRISKSKRAQDFGKALIMIITIIFVIIMYSVMFLLNQLIANPQFKNWLIFYPSFWFTNIILYTIDPILISSYILNLWASIAFSIGIPLLVLYLSYNKAKSFFNYESISIQERSVKEEETVFYKGLREVMKGKWSGLIITQIKLFLRRKANLARIVYVVGLLGFMGWFTTSFSDLDGLVLGTSMIINIGGAVGSLMLGNMIFIESKDIIWNYKKSPRGINAVVYSYLFMMMILGALFSLFLTIFRAIFIGFDVIFMLVFFILLVVNYTLCMMQTIGLQARNPAYGEKDANMKSNTLVSMVILQPIIMIPIFLLIVFHPRDPFQMVMIMIVPALMYNLILGISLLYFGVKKLKRLE